MPEFEKIEGFPKNIVITCILFSLIIYLLGAYILTRFGYIAAIIYLLYGLIIEIYVISRSYGSCYYFGKIYAFSTGWPKSQLTKKNDLKQHVKTSITCWGIIPEILIVIFPLISGIHRLIINFSWFCLGLLILFFILYFIGVRIIRKYIICRYCKQRGINCPLERLSFKRGKISLV